MSAKPPRAGARDDASRATSPQRGPRLATELNRFRGTAPMDDDQAFLLLTEVRGAGASLGQRFRFERGSFLFPANN